MEFKSASGLKCSFDKRGAGEKVLLVHGFCEDGFIWQETAGRLVSKYELIIPDLPGFGASAIPPDGFTMKDYAAWLNELVDELWDEPCWFIGHSMGGYIGLAYADFFQDKLKGLALVNSHVFADNKEKKAARVKFIEFLKQHGPEPVLKELYQNLFTPEYLNQHPERLATLMDRARNFRADGIIRAAEAMMQRPNRLELWSKLELPCLVLAGKQDPLIPESRSIEQASKGNEVMIEIINDMGHMGPIEQPETVAEILDSFLVQSLNLIKN